MSGTSVYKAQGIPSASYRLFLAALAGDQDVPETSGADEAGLGCLALYNGVGADGGAVTEISALDRAALSHEFFLGAGHMACRHFDGLYKSVCIVTWRSG